MRVMFVYWAFENQGSGLIIQGYVEAAKRLGHEIAVYGRPRPNIPLNYSLDIESADAIVFLFEWTTQLLGGDALDLVRLVNKIPRRRRVIVDGDGNYNDVIHVDGDYNHRTRGEAQQWTAVCDSLSDKICQPTLHPLRHSVRPFLFYAYNPGWERSLEEWPGQEFALTYVGHSKFRWRPMQQILRGIEPARGQLGRIGLVGYGWSAPPPWAKAMQMEDAYYSDVEYLRKLDIEVFDPIPFEGVIDCMGKAAFNPVISRPTFNKLRLVTPRFFETPAASTVPLFGLDADYIAEIYGPDGAALVLRGDSGRMLLELLSRPAECRDLVHGVREHLRTHHSQMVRLKELIEIIES
jgi:hypothetical protein